jgi:small subunit ribosomal protein S13
MSNEFKHIVRVLGTDLDGSLKVPYALSKIKGVGIFFGYAISRALNINPDERIGFLSENQIQKIEDAISNPLSYGIPSWLLNRRRDLKTGKDLHLHGSDLVLTIKEDIEREKKIKSWRGVRHSLGLKVRGQRTKTTGRKHAAVGVLRRAIAQAQTQTEKKEKKE